MDLVLIRRPRWETLNEVYGIMSIVQWTYVQMKGTVGRSLHVLLEERLGTGLIW